MSSRASCSICEGNPGGLLDQAAKVVDTFVTDGPIVATVGASERGARREIGPRRRYRPNYPLALLVTAAPARTRQRDRHRRAEEPLTGPSSWGDTTFGKGSVQLVFTDLPDKAALKLTIAQYLTEPGDVSIQGVGVTPDIELDAMTVDPLEMDLTADTGGIKERDLSRALSNVRAKEKVERPSMEIVQYDLPMKDRMGGSATGGGISTRTSSSTSRSSSLTTSSPACSRASARTRCGRGGSSSPTRARWRWTRSPRSSAASASTGATRRRTSRRPRRRPRRRGRGQGRDRSREQRGVGRRAA